METSTFHRHSQPPFRNLFFKTLKVIFPVLLMAGALFVGKAQGIIYAQQAADADHASLADQGASGIVGYVVGNVDVPAYNCPDVNTIKCPIKLMLKPGTVVLIVDNVVGSNITGLNDNGWRKIFYQNLTLFVPMRYIAVGTPGTNGSAGYSPDVSLVQINIEDDSTSSPNFPQDAPTTHTGISIVPASACVGVCGINGIVCPPGYSPFYTNIKLGLGDCRRPVTFTTPGDQHTWYIASDGRVNGGAGDRIAIYCRRDGRIEVWSINDSQGHFLVSFRHEAVDAPGKGSLSVTVPGQGVVTLGGDGHGLYWAAIHGGPYNATGEGDFAKTFTCYQSSQ